MHRERGLRLSRIRHEHTKRILGPTRDDAEMLAHPIDSSRPIEVVRENSKQLSASCSRFGLGALNQAVEELRRLRPRARVARLQRGQDWAEVLAAVERAEHEQRAFERLSAFVVQKLEDERAAVSRLCRRALLRRRQSVG